VVHCVADGIISTDREQMLSLRKMCAVHAGGSVQGCSCRIGALRPQGRMLGVARSHLAVREGG
jgi:hypothetical protein